MPLPTVDIFLKKISASEPVGKSLKYVVYDSIKEARRTDDGLPKGVWQEDLKVADWKKVEALCVEALTKKSKDLQICAWLTEAWLFLYGLEGLCRGLELFDAIAQKYWENVYPQIEEDGDKGFRLSPYIWLNEKLSHQMKILPIVGSPDTKTDSLLTFADYLAIKTLWGRRESGIAIPQDKEESLKIFEQGIKKTQKSFFQDMKNLLESLSKMTEQIEAFVTRRCSQQEAPSLSRLRSVTQELVAFCDQALKWGTTGEKAPSVDTLRGKAALPEEEKKKSVDTDSSPRFQNEIPQDVGAVVKSRDEAYQVIGQIADYLELLDPHSPVPPMIKRALRLGKMPLKDVLQEVVQEPAALSNLKNLFGFAEEVSPVLVSEMHNTKKG